LFLCVSALSAAPDWVPDPEHSRWITLAEKEETHGVFQLLSTSEGTLQPTTRAGRACWEVVPTPKENGGGGGRYWYFHVGDWNEWVKWIGEKDVQLTFVYFDGKPGGVYFSYDSRDQKVKLVPQHVGAWRTAEDLESGHVVLKGSNEWKTKTISLPLALFLKRCNGGDFRFGPVPKDSDFALAGVAVTRVAAKQLDAAPAPDRLELPASFVRSEGVVVEGRRVRFPGRFAQEPGKPIVMEAECATSLQTDGRGELGIDPTASGGAYVHYVVGADYAFTVKTPGKYQAWERGRYPHDGSWNHSEMLGNQSVATVSDSMVATKDWIWVKAGLYELNAGEHTFQISYHAGAQLDQIIFLPVGAPGPAEPLPASPNIGPKEGWAETSDLRPLDVKKWLEFVAEFPLGDAAKALALEYSQDNGRSYRPLPADCKLESITTEGSGRDRIRLRVRLKTDGGAPPFVQNVKVAYAPGPNNQITLANAVASLAFNAGGLVSLKHLRTEHAHSRAGAVAPLFALGLKKPGDAPLQEVTNAAGALEGYELIELSSSKRLDLTYRMANGMVVTAHVLLDPTGQSRWTMDIDNPTDLEVAEIEYPILPGVRLGDDPSDDFLFFPRCWGQVWPHPASKGLRGLEWGPHMRWMDLWDKTDGLYIGVHDDALNDTGLGPVPDTATSLRMSVRQRIYVKPGGKWTSAPRVVAFHGGDWHEGADIYKSYTAKALKQPDPAEWLRWIDTWDTQGSNDMPYKGWAQLYEDMDRMNAQGIELMAANRQMLDGMDSGYCGLYLYPAIGWGTTKEFAQALSALRRRGIHYTPYMNWHLWSPGYGHHLRCGITPWASLPKDAPRRDDAWWEKIAARNYDGTFSKVVQDRYAQMDADIGAPEWRERLADWTRRYNEWGGDGMYYDQFNMNYFSGRLPKDYDTYGFWTRGTLDTLRKVKNEARKTNPYYVSSGEAYMDALGQAVDLHMTSGVVNRLEFYMYCNPRQRIIDGGWNGGLSEAFGGHERQRFIWQVGALFEGLQGKEPWRSQILALRRKVKSLLYRSEFRDTVGLTIRKSNAEIAEPEPGGYPFGSENAPYRGMVGRWFLFRDGSQRAAIINLINTPLDDTAILTINTSDFGPVRAAWAFTLEGELKRVDGKQEGNVYRFNLPKAEMASIVLVNRVAPIVQWSADPTVTGGESGSFRLSLTNLDPDASTGVATLRPPKGWPVASQKVGAVAPGTTTEVTFPIRVPANTRPGRYDVRAEVATPGGTFTAYSMVSVAEPVVAEFRGNPGGYHLLIENLTSKPVKGMVTVSASTPLKVSVSGAFELLAKGKAELPVTVEGQDQLTQISEMSAQVTTSLAKWNLVRAVMPIVSNGDFEMDGAGDMRPDWWMCRKLRDEWDPESMRLEPDAPSGKYCLRLDASDNPEGFTRAYSVNGAVKSNTKYRFSAWIKKASAERSVAVQFSGFGWRSLSATKVGEWEHLQGEVATGPQNGYMVVSCINQSRGAAWFDGIKVEEVK